MMRKTTLVAIMSALCFVFISVAGCGGASSGVGALDNGCNDSEAAERISLRSSELSCASAHAILDVLAARQGIQRVDTGGRPWFCLGYSASRYPLKYRCHQGHKYFQIVDTGPNPAEG
jgi:hypothetical protein